MFDLIIWNLPYVTIPASGPYLEPMEEASMLDLGKDGWSSELRSYLESHENMLSRTGCVLLLYRTYPDSPSKPEDWLKSGWTSRKMSQRTMGDEMLCVYSHWRPWGGLDPIEVDTIKSTMDYDFTSKRGVKESLQTGKLKVGVGEEKNGFQTPWVGCNMVHHRTRQYQFWYVPGSSRCDDF